MKFKFLLFSIGLGTLAVILNTQCTKITPTDIGTDLLPAVDNIQTFEASLRVYADNYLTNDSSRINYSEDHALGIIADDPEFGRTEGQVYFAVVPTSADRNPFINLDSIVGMDSVILSLAYKGIYGDSTSQQKINVYEIDDAAFQDSIGYLVSHPEFGTTGVQLGSKMVDFTTIDDPKTIVVKRDTQVVNNLLRIPLDPSLGMRFATYDTASVYLTARRDSAFQVAFNGLALKTDEAGSPQKNALAYYNLYDDNTKLTCYFRIKKAGDIDTVAVDFKLYITGTYTGYNANLVKRTAMHGYAGLSIGTAIPDADEVYLQSSPGSYAILTVPGLDTMQNAIIHRAEIAFEPLDLPGNTIYTTPDFLFLDLVDSANNRYLTVRDDFVYSFATFTYDSQLFGGYLDDGKYFINLTRYVQNLVTTHSKNYPLRLYAPKTAYAYYSYPKATGSAISPARVAFRINEQIAKGRAYVGGGKNSAKPMRLRIIYSKI